MMIWSPEERDLPTVSVTVASQQALLANLRARIGRGAGFAVATLNLDHVVKLRRDPAFRAAYASQTHVTADGRPIVWLSRCAGDDVSLVTGSDLVDPVAALCAELSAPVALVGSTPEILAEATRKLQEKHPGLIVAATCAPPMGFEPGGPAADGIIETLGASGARVCFLALGAPKQEVFAAHALNACPDMGFLSVGAGLDFITGAQLRAPRLMRALALEWLWRLALAPRRLAARYAACITILPGLLVTALHKRRATRRGGAA